jgi:hypothetical protein
LRFERAVRFTCSIARRSASISQDSWRPYRNAGAKRATIADLRVTKLDSASVIATVRWNALSEDGTLLRDFTVSYQMLRKEPDRWRMLSYTYHAGRARSEEN